MNNLLKKRLSGILAFVMIFTTAFANLVITTVYADSRVGERKIDIWDFGGVTEDKTVKDAEGNDVQLYNNNITLDTLNGLTDYVSGGKWSKSPVPFGDLNLYPTTGSDRLRYFSEDKVTAGTLSYDAWGSAQKKFTDGYQGNGVYFANGYCNAPDTNRFLTIDNVVKGDKITVYAGFSNGDEDIVFKYLGTDGEQEDRQARTTTSYEPVSFVADYSGTYKIYSSQNNSGKPFYFRIIRTPGVQVTAKVNDASLNGSELKFVNSVTNKEVEATFDNGVYTAVVAPGYEYVAVLSAEGSQISNNTKAFTVSEDEIFTGATKEFEVSAAKYGTLTGKINGFTADDNNKAENIKLTFVAPVEAHVDPVEAKINDDLSYSAELEQDYEYTAQISGINDWELADSYKITMTGKTAELDVTVKAVTTYDVNGKFKGITDGSSVSSVTLVRMADNYTYNATVENDGYSVKVPVGEYLAKAVCSGFESYDEVNHIIVTTSGATKNITLKSNDVTEWDVCKITADEFKSGSYKGLVFSANDFKPNGQSIVVSKGSNILIPIKSGKVVDVEVKGWYSGNIKIVTNDDNETVLAEGSFDSSQNYSSPGVVKCVVDNTDGNTKYVKAVAGTDVTTYLSYISAVPRTEEINTKDLYVGVEGQKYNYATVKEALAVAKSINPQSEADRVTIHIAPGTYRAQLIVETPYISLINTDPSKEVKITWYYGFGYNYYSVGSDGFYNEEKALDQYYKNNVSNGKWGATVFVKNSATGFRAENIVFENSFNKYVTDEELEDGVELCPSVSTPTKPAFPQSTSIKFERTKGADVTTRAAIERSAAMEIEADQCEFNNCSFLGSQDTLIPNNSSAHQYYKNCFIDGNVDYICGDGNLVFDECTLNFAGYSDQSFGGYITAMKDAATYGSLFRNCKVTGTDGKQIGAGYFGRPWGAGAKVVFLNTSLANDEYITAAGWNDMSGAKPENADFQEYATTVNGQLVDASSRRGKVITAEDAIKYNATTYFEGWTPSYFTGEVETPFIRTLTVKSENASLTLNDKEITNVVNDITDLVDKTFEAKVVAKENATIESVEVKMGGAVVESAYNTETNVISIEKVTGDIVVTIKTTEGTQNKISLTVKNENASLFVNDKEITEEVNDITDLADQKFEAKVVAKENATIESVEVKMGDTVIEGAYNTETGIISVEKVTGDITITIKATVNSNPTPSPDPDPDKTTYAHKVGDVNHDKKLTSDDALVVITGIINNGYKNISDDELAITDVNGDKKIDATDVTAIIKNIIKGIPFKVGEYVQVSTKFEQN